MTFLSSLTCLLLYMYVMHIGFKMLFVIDEAKYCLWEKGNIFIYNNLLFNWLHFTKKKNKWFCANIYTQIFMNENEFIVFAFRYVKYYVLLFRLHVLLLWTEYVVRRIIKNESSSKSMRFFSFHNSGEQT